MANKKALYPNIIAELARYGLSVRDLADYMGMSSQNLYSKFRGTTALSLKDMELIQLYFKDKAGGVFTLDYLFNNGKS